MGLCNKRITKALISLCGCAGWSASVLFENSRRQVFSRCGPYNSFSVMNLPFRCQANFLVLAKMTALVFDVLYLFTTSVTTGTSFRVGAKNWLTILNITSYVPANVCSDVHKVGHLSHCEVTMARRETTFAQARARLSLSHKTKSRALGQMACGTQCNKLMRVTNALTGLVICLSLFHIHSTMRNTNA